MLQIKFPKQAPHNASASLQRKRKADDVAQRLRGESIYDPPNLSLRAWKNQKPRMSSARIMIEVRRRLWIEVCSENTGFYDTEKLLKRINALSKRIEKRVVEEPLEPRQIKVLEKLFEGAYAGDQGATMGMSY